MPSKKKLRKQIKRLKNANQWWLDQTALCLDQSHVWETRFFELMRATDKDTFITSDGVMHVADPQCSQGLAYHITKDNDSWGSE